MFRIRIGVAGVAVSAALVLGAAACSSSNAPPGSGGGKPIKGGTATVALSAGITYSWIFPFYAITNSSVYDVQQFQWLMYRPLYMFGNNTNTSVGINYPLSPANPPKYSNGGKTVTVTMKGWKWSDGESVDARSVIFYLNMAKAEKANWYAYSKGLLPFEIGVAAIASQGGHSPNESRELLRRLVASYGSRVPGLERFCLTHTFPSPAVLADPRIDLREAGLPADLAVVLQSYASAIVQGVIRLNGSLSGNQLVSSISALPGVSASSAQYLALRMGEPDAFPAEDAILQKVPGGSGPAVGQGWQPWRAYAAAHIWAAASRPCRWPNRAVVSAEEGGRYRGQPWQKQAR